MSTDPDLLEEGEQAEQGAEGSATKSAPPSQSTATDPGKTAQPKPTIGPLPEAEKYAEALKAWEYAAATAMVAVDKLVSSLEATGDELALAISGIIQKAQSDFPDTLDEALTGLAKSAKAGNAVDTEVFRNKSEIAIRAGLAYLNNNAKTFEGCENNPFGVTVQIRRRSPNCAAPGFDFREEVGVTRGHIVLPR